MRDPLADALVAAERRLLSLERRFRDFASQSVKYLHQLLDVDITYDGPSAVADGDVLTYDADIERWVNGPGGGGGIVSYIRVSDGVRQIGMDFVDDEWYIPDETSTGVQVRAAGLYLVHARGFYGSTVKIQVTGDSFDGDSSNCVANVATDYGGDSSSASAIFPLPEDASIDVVATSDGSPSWTLDVALLVETWIEPGVCL